MSPLSQPSFCVSPHITTCLCSLFLAWSYVSCHEVSLAHGFPKAWCVGLTVLHTSFLLHFPWPFASSYLGVVSQVPLWWVSSFPCPWALPISVPRSAGECWTSGLPSTRRPRRSQSKPQSFASEKKSLKVNRINDHQLRELPYSSKCETTLKHPTFEMKPLI